MSEGHKRGKLHKAEEQVIRDNINKLSIEEIARSLNRTTEPIARFIKDNNLISEQMDDAETRRIRLRGFLHSRNYWADVQKQFAADELETWEENWIQVFQQFREDCSYTEELDIKQLCNIEALINRNLSSTHQCRKNMDTIQQKLDAEYEKDKDMRDMQYIGNLEAQLSFMRTAIPAYTTEFQKLCEKKDSVTKSLKATRDQRVKRIEDSKTSWIGVIRALEDAELRDRVGDEVELMKIAKDRAYDRLGQNHQYMDNKVDRPILNADTLDLEEGENNG